MKSKNSSDRLVSVKNIDCLYKNEGSGRYYVRLYFSQAGKARNTYRSLQTTNLKIAKQRMRKMLLEHDKDRESLSRLSSEDPTMGEIFDAFLEMAEKDPDISEKTRSHRRVNIKRLRKTWPEMDSVKVRKLTNLACRQWIDRLKTQPLRKPPPGSKQKPKRYSPASINHSITTLKLALEFSLSMGYIPKVPMEGIKRAKVLKDPLQLPSREQMEAVFREMQFQNSRLDSKSLEELKAEEKTQTEMAEEMGVSLATLKRHLKHMKNGTLVEAGRGKAASDAARFLAYSGTRRGEAATICWSHVYFDQNRLHVPGYKSATSNRIIPMIPALMKLLKQLRESDPKASKNDPIFPILNSSQGINRGLASASKRVGLPKLTHHQLRHYFATVVIESGVDIPTLSGWLGHNDGGVLAMKTYGHLRDEHSQAAAEKVVF